MATVLPQIYEALGAIPVVLNGAVATVWTPANMHNRVNSADLPLRIITPIGRGGSGKAQSLALQAAGSGAAKWTVYELILLGPTAQGRGLQEYSGELVATVKAYTDAITNDHIRLMRGVIIGEIGYEMAVFNYNGTDYYALEIQLSIAEIMN